MLSTILASAQKLVSPHKSLWEDPLDLLQMAYKEALLVHVVAVIRLYVILVDLLLQDREVLPIRRL
jgi:hypothetical protein